MVKGANPDQTVFRGISVSFQPFVDWIPDSGYYANSADPVQIPQNVASDQGLHYLLTEISLKIH